MERERLGLIPSGKASQRTLDLYRQHYRVHLEKPLGSTPIQKITAKTISGLLSDLRTSGLAENTVRGILTVLSALLTFAVEQDILAVSPMRKLPKKVRPEQKNSTEARRLDPQQLRRLVAATPIGYRSLIATLAYSGLRISEALGLVWADVDLQAGQLHVRKQLSRSSRNAPPKRVKLKTHRSARSVPISPVLSEILRQHRQEALSNGLHGPERFVFTTLTGTPLHYKNVSDRVLTPSADRAGLNPPSEPRVTFHNMRHSFASNLILTGEDVVQVAAWLGDSPDLVLRVYAGEIGSQPERVKRGQAAIARAFA